MLLLGRGKGCSCDPGCERRDRVIPAGAEGVEVVAVASLADERFHGVEQEPRRHAVGRAAQVAAREQQHARPVARSERGEQHAVVDVDPRRAQRQRAVGGTAVDVGEQRVVAHPRRERALRHPADEDAVEVEPQPQRDVPHEDALAEPADAAEVGVELQLERAEEHVDPRCRFHRVEAGEALERGLHLVGRFLLRLGPAGCAACRGRETYARGRVPTPTDRAIPHRRARPRVRRRAATRRTRRARASRSARAGTSRAAARGRAPRAPWPVPFRARSRGVRAARATVRRPARCRRAG